MENNEKGFINIQLLAEDSQGAATPDTTNTQSTIDYESEYKKVLAERDSFKAEVEKQKGLKDNYAKENAEYKRKELEKMTDDEKKAKELQDLIESKNKMEAEIRTMKLEKDLLANGFTTEESAELIKDNFAVSTIAKIMKSKIEEAVKSAKAEGLKETTPSSPMGNGTTNGETKSGFQVYQESQEKKSKKVEI